MVHPEGPGCGLGDGVGTEQTPDESGAGVLDGEDQGALINGDVVAGDPGGIAGTVGVEESEAALRGVAPDKERTVAGLEREVVAEGRDSGGGDEPLRRERCRYTPCAASIGSPLLLWRHQAAVRRCRPPIYRSTLAGVTATLAVAAFNSHNPRRGPQFSSIRVSTRSHSAVPAAALSTTRSRRNLRDYHVERHPRTRLGVGAG